MKTDRDFFSQLASFVAKAAGLFAVAVLGCILYLPSYKGMWLGYIPIVAGCGAALLLRGRVGRAGVDGLGRLPRKTYLLLLLLGPALVQLLLLLWLRPEPALDGAFVYEQAVHFLRTGEMPPLTYYAPAQIWWYALVFRWFGVSPFVAQASNVPLLLCTLYLLYRLARRWMSEPAARAAALAVGYYPSFLLYVLVTPYYFYLYTLCLVLLATALLCSVEGGRWRMASAAAGVAAGLGALTKAVLLIAPAQSLLFWGLSLRPPRIRAVAIRWGLFVLLMCLVLAPWTWRNVRLFGEAIPVCTSGGLVLYSANNPTSNGLYSGLPDEAAIASPGEMLAYSRQCSARAFAFMRNEPLRFLRLVALKNLHTWGTETTYAELVNVRGRHLPWVDRLVSLVVQTAWVALVVLWVSAAVGSLRRRPGPFALLAAIFLWSAVLLYSVYEGGARHHLPLVPFLFLWVFESFTTRERGRCS